MGFWGSRAALRTGTSTENDVTGAPECECEKPPGDRDPCVRFILPGRKTSVAPFWLPTGGARGAARCPRSPPSSPVRAGPAGKAGWGGSTHRARNVCKIDGEQKGWENIRFSPVFLSHWCVNQIFPRANVKDFTQNQMGLCCMVNFGACFVFWNEKSQKKRPVLFFLFWKL